MEKVSLRAQRVLMVIPIANAFGLFVWLYNYSRSERKQGVFFKSLLILFASVIPLAILEIVLSRIFSEQQVVLSVLNLLFIYLIPFVMDFFLIRYQESLKD